MREEVNRIGTDGATNWLRAKLLAFQFAVLRAKVRGAVAVAYFGMRPVISSCPKEPARARTHTHSPTEKWVAAGSFKVSTRFLGATGEGYEPEASKGERTKLRVAGGECRRQERQETERVGDRRRVGRG